jgi:hypothetical protein
MFDSDTVDASGEAYVLGRKPDGHPGRGEFGRDGGSQGLVWALQSNPGNGIGQRYDKRSGGRSMIGVL